MLHILDTADARSRTILEKSLGHPSRIVLLVKGDVEGVGSFVTRASDMATQPWRDVIWLKHPDLVADSAGSEYFESPSTDDFEAPLLGFRDQVVTRLPMDATGFRIGRAFLDAEAAE